MATLKQHSGHHSTRELSIKINATRRTRDDETLVFVDDECRWHRVEIFSEQLQQEFDSSHPTVDHRASIFMKWRFVYVLLVLKEHVSTHSLRTDSVM